MNENKSRELVGRYYSYFLGAEDNLFGHFTPQPVLLYTPVRNTPLQGYGQRFDVLAIATETTTAISFGDAAVEKTSQLETLLQTNNVSLYEAIYQSFNTKPIHSIKYYFNGEASEKSSARLLTSLDYHAFETFFRLNNPNAKDITWLRDYFEEMISEKTCCGVFIDCQLVSCTDSPAVPFMPDIIKEIGINTLKEYRNLGFAKDACSCAIREITKQGKIPIWSTDVSNIPSQKLAESLGFEKWGELYSVALNQLSYSSVPKQK